LQESNTDLYLPALETMSKLIRASTTSMTSVPKPLKFMRPHYETMKEIHRNMSTQGLDKNVTKLCAEIISVLGMTMGSCKECLVYRLLIDEGTDDIGEWGHEYIRHLSAEIAVNWPETSGQFKTRLVELVRQIIPYNMAHNAEAEACDLLMEIERLDLLEEYVDESAYPRVCLYLQSCYPFMADPDNNNLLKCALQLSRKFKQYTPAMRLAMMLNDVSLIEDIFKTCPDM
jgi:26S proteasome regulatory subunit N1